MPTPTDNNKKEPLSDAEVERLLFEAMRLAGELPPSSIQEIRQLEAELDASPIPLPANLQNADAIFKRAERLPTAVVIQFPASTETKENLARAAREGGKISETAETRMKQDRQAEEDDQGKR